MSSMCHMRFQQSSSRQHQSALELLAALCERPLRPLRHVLGFAADVHRRCNINGELAARVAESLGFERGAVYGLAKLLRSGTFSPERLAVTAMLDPCLDDDDIAEIFGRSLKWARIVREQQGEIRSAEPMDESLEWFDPDFQPDDPLPDEIRRRAMEVRASDLRPGMRERYRAGIRSFSWNGKNGAFVCHGVA